MVLRWGRRKLDLRRTSCSYQSNNWQEKTFIYSHLWSTCFLSLSLVVNNVNDGDKWDQQVVPCDRTAPPWQQQVSWPPHFPQKTPDTELEEIIQPHISMCLLKYLSTLHVCTDWTNGAGVCTVWTEGAGKNSDAAGTQEAHAVPDRFLTDAEPSAADHIICARHHPL